jgi:hypothetical protein
MLHCQANIWQGDVMGQNQHGISNDEGWFHWTKGHCLLRSHTQKKS